MVDEGNRVDECRGSQGPRGDDGLRRVGPGRADARPEGLGGSRSATGRLGEAVAAEYLGRLGYRVVQTNVRTRHGELDIVAWEGDVLAFVEVRTRRGPQYGTPEESITRAKRQKLAELAEAYLQTLPEPPPACRIDVVVVDLGPGARVRRVELIRDAV